LIAAHFDDGASALLNTRASSPQVAVELRRSSTLPPGDPISDLFVVPDGHGVAIWWVKGRRSANKNELFESLVDRDFSP
jgi:hypothetical protein